MKFFVDTADVDDIRDLAAVDISIEAAEVEETRETFDTPISPEIGPWTDAS